MLMMLLRLLFFCVVDVETAVDFVLVVDVIMLLMSVKRRRERVDFRR